MMTDNNLLAPIGFYVDAPGSGPAYVYDAGAHPTHLRTVLPAASPVLTGGFFGIAVPGSASAASATTSTYIYDATHQTLSAHRTSSGATSMPPMPNYGYRYYSPALGRWLSRDPIGEEGGDNLYGYVENDPASRNDPFGLAFYAVGGTWERADDKANPWWLYNETAEKPAKYYQGPGFRLGIKDPIRAAHGRDTVAIAKRVKDDICKDFCEEKKKCKDMPINLTGWSRGAVICMGVAKMLNDDGCKCGGFWIFGGKRYKPVDVNWIGLFDAVEMVLAPGQLLGASFFPGTVPGNVKNFAHAIKTEKQQMFPTTLYGQHERAFNRNDGRKTTHNDIGNSNTLGNNEAYNWIKTEAIIAGVEF